MKSLISAHNLRPRTKESKCNSRDKNDFPINNKCHTIRLIYQADVTNNVDDKSKYLVLMETTFKERFNNQKRLLRNESKRTSSELLKYVRLYKKDGKIPTIKWKLIKLIFSKTKTSFCILCFQMP